MGDFTTIPLNGGKSGITAARPDAGRSGGGGVMSDTTLPDALARMEAFAASHESTPEEAQDIRFINGAVNDLLFVLRALVVESGGKAIPNDRLTMARSQVVATLAKWGVAA